MPKKFETQVIIPASLSFTIEIDAESADEAKEKVTYQMKQKQIKRFKINQQTIQYFKKFYLNVYDIRDDFESPNQTTQDGVPFTIARVSSKLKGEK